jgi:hypothetical protein
VSVLRFGIISSLPWSRAGARIFARESTSSHQPIRNENSVASSLYTFGHAGDGRRCSRAREWAVEQAFATYESACDKFNAP